MTEASDEGLFRTPVLDLQRHRAEDGTLYWSLVLGSLALHILMENGRYVAMDLLGHRLGVGVTPEEAGLQALFGRDWGR